MRVREYVKIAEGTDRLPKRGQSAKISPLLGLAGEIGSLLTELKKEVREPEGATTTKMRVAEELGDILWYASTIAKRARLDFQRDILFGNLERIKSNYSESNIAPAPLFGDVLEPGGDVANELQRRGKRIADTFRSYQSVAVRTSRYSDNREALVPFLVQIWKNSGDLLTELNLSSYFYNTNEARVVASVLGDVMWYVASFASLYDLNLDDIAVANADKVKSLFPKKNERIPTPLYDEEFTALEQFPRIFDVDFVPLDDETTVMLINGVRVGDPLRDNAYQTEVGEKGEIEGYRFHDSIHLAFVAILCWSPVMRALLKRKRKSKRMIDEADDGARAIIVEEMIVKLTHSYAIGIDPEKLLHGQKRVGVDLLKQVVVLAKGLEVVGGRKGASAKKYWEWEKAILEGYKIYNKLRRHRRGRIRVNMKERSVAFSRLKKGEGDRFPAPFGAV